MKEYLKILQLGRTEKINGIILIRKYLGVPHILVILSGCKYLCGIYYVFNNKYRCSVNVKKRKKRKRYQ